MVACHLYDTPTSSFSGSTLGINNQETKETETQPHDCFQSNGVVTMEIEFDLACVGRCFEKTCSIVFVIVFPVY